MDCPVECCIDCYTTDELIQVWIEVSFELTLRIVVQIIRLGPVVIVACSGAYVYYYVLKNPRFSGVATVISGNTLEIKGKQVRIFGIVALKHGQEVHIPPDKWDGFDYSKEKLEALVGEKKVKCVVTNWHGKWERIEGRCYLKGDDVGRRMVKDGHVFADTDYSYEYKDVEEKARRKKLGFHGAVHPPRNPKNWANQKEREARVKEYVRRRLPGDPALMTLEDLRAHVDVEIEGGFLVRANGSIELG
ncbi:MAG: thermonuclease family protein [Geminicoccaceae bacterium]